MPWKLLSKKVAVKTGEFLGNKIADTITKSNKDNIVRHHENSGHVGKIIIPLEKRGEILNRLRKVYYTL